MAGKRSDEQFNHLTVKDNVIDTGLRTISIRNISTVGIEEIYPYRRFGIIFIIFIGFATISALYNFTRTIIIVYLYGFASTVIGWILILFICFVILRYVGWKMYKYSRCYLLISSNSGVSSWFFHRDFSFLNSAKAAIDERINNPESDSQFTVNFNKGSIEQMSVDNMGGVSNMSAETVVSESPGANVASHSAGAQVGIGNTMEVNTSYVNYETYLPHVEKIREAVPDRRPDLNIEDQLDELIDLMRQGSPTREDKSRVEQLALNLGQILQGYPPMVRLFNDIASLVGRFI